MRLKSNRLPTVFSRKIPVNPQRLNTAQVVSLGTADGQLRWSRGPALPPSPFSEMSPACFRPAFDGIREAWFDGCAKERNNPAIILPLVRHRRWCVL
jgi:hypothetical protein